MRTLRFLGILGLALLGMTGASPVTDTPWRPKGSYWGTYGTVIVKAVCDSMGNVQQAEIVFSGVSPAEADSVLNVVKKARYDPSTHDGRIRKGQYEYSPNVPDPQFIVPFAIRNKENAVKPLVTRKELEQAGLGPWLAIWDRLLPDWPVESWSYTGTVDYYEYSSRIDDARMDSLGMISVSPDRRWHLDPFQGVYLPTQGRPEFDHTSGFLVYASGDSGRIRQHVTGNVNYDSAEWIDNHRFVVTATNMIQLDHGGRLTLYRSPIVFLGDVNSSKFRSIQGPPVPINVSAEMRKRLDQYQETRYPKFFNLLR